MTGRLSKPFYSDACLFEGPDPDMPVRGLAKYCSASSNLFDHTLSKCDLLAIGEATDRATGETLPVVFWRIEGVVNLPWHPTIKPYVGATLFQTDEQGLVAQATEFWSITAFDAFATTLFPEFGAPAARPAPELIREIETAQAAAGGRAMERIRDGDGGRAEGWGWEGSSFTRQLRDFPDVDVVLYPTAQLEGRLPDLNWFSENRRHGHGGAETEAAPKTGAFAPAPASGAVHVPL